MLDKVKTDSNPNIATDTLIFIFNFKNWSEIKRKYANYYKLIVKELSMKQYNIGYSGSKLKIDFKFKFKFILVYSCYIYSRLVNGRLIYLEFFWKKTVP